MRIQNPIIPEFPAGTHFMRRNPVLFSKFLSIIHILRTEHHRIGRLPNWRPLVQQIVWHNRSRQYQCLMGRSEPCITIDTGHMHHPNNNCNFISILTCSCQTIYTCQSISQSTFQNTVITFQSTCQGTFQITCQSTFESTFQTTFESTFQSTFQNTFQNTFQSTLSE